MINKLYINVSCILHIPYIQGCMYMTYSAYRKDADRRPHIPHFNFNTNTKINAEHSKRAGSNISKKLFSNKTYTHVKEDNTAGCLLIPALASTRPQTS